MCVSCVRTYSVWQVLQFFSSSFKRKAAKKRKKYITSSGILIKKLFIIILLLFCCFCVACSLLSLPLTSGTCNKIMVHEYLSKDYKWTSKILATTFTKRWAKVPRSTTKENCFPSNFFNTHLHQCPYVTKKVLLAH